ncbi:hypothetical protein GIB67_034902 [Kingdonia uniflora]|uniref:Uncharacterized protein n=1 Tax=Kingdonia uniflora TaxID=39325 RepID=A0A7J7NGI2_9MAGN|nr:hypothetical protein GIB67_034902 [Kingdonia uniflora]
MPLFIMASSIGRIWFSKRQEKPPSLGWIVCLQTYFHHHTKSSLLRSISYASWWRILLRYLISRSWYHGNWGYIGCFVCLFQVPAVGAICR